MIFTVPKTWLNTSRIGKELRYLMREDGTLMDSYIDYVGQGDKTQCPIYYKARSLFSSDTICCAACASNCSQWSKLYITIWRGCFNRDQPYLHCEICKNKIPSQNEA